MKYGVRIGSTEYLFDDSEEAIGFAKTAKLKCTFYRQVIIEVYSDEELINREKKEDE